MFSQMRAGPLNVSGDGTQELDSRRSNTANLQETSAASSGVTGEQFIQWKQRVTATRQGKEAKLRQEILVVESGGRRITQLKTDNEQLVGEEDQLAAESKMEEEVSSDTEVQLGFLEEQLHEVGRLCGMTKQMQEQEESAKVELDSRLRDMEESFCRVQLTEKEEKIKLDEGIRPVKAGVEAQFVKAKGVLEAAHKQHSAVLESKVLQGQRMGDLYAEVEASTKMNIEQEEGVRVKTEAALERKFCGESKVEEVVKNKSLLEELVIKVAADEDVGTRKLSNVKEDKKLAKEKSSQVQECVNQLRQAATSRQIERGALINQVGHLEASKKNQEQRKNHLQGDIDKLNKLRKQAEVALGRKAAAEKLLGIMKKTQQEKFREEEERVVLQGQVQVACEQEKLRKGELDDLESQIGSEQANLQKLRTECLTSNERKLSCCSQNEKLHSMVAQNREENGKVFETRMKTTKEKLKMLKVENGNLVELVEALNREVVDALAENMKLEQQIASAEAEVAEEEQMFASAKSDKEDLAEDVKKAVKETERLKCTIHPKEEELSTKKERSNTLAVKLNQVSEERRSTEENLESNTCSLSKVELNIQQLDSKTKNLKILEAEVGDQLAEALSLLQQGERKQELRGEHAENMKKVKKLQKAMKQVKSEMTVVIKRKEKLERQCGKTRLEKSKVKEEVDQVDVDIKTKRNNVEVLLAAGAEDEKVLLSGKKELEQRKAEADEEASQSQVLRSRTKGLKDRIKKAEGLLREEMSKVEEQTMMLEEKRSSSARRLSKGTETECRDLEQSLHTFREHLQQSQGQKKQLMESMGKMKEELEVVEKAISTASRKTPQQLRKSGSDRNRLSTPLPLLKKEAVFDKQGDSFRTPANVPRRTPEQLRKASPLVHVTSRGNRSLLQPPMSPVMQNQARPSLIREMRASPNARKSPFDVASYSDSD